MSIKYPEMGIFESTCPKCGKVFVKQPYHVYVGSAKGKTRAYCSWTCFNHRKDDYKKEKK